MVLTQSLRVTQRLAQSLTLHQRLAIQELQFSTRLNLIQALRDEEYKPKAECQKCFRKLTPIEIIQGFNDDPTDYTTRCSGCGHRFEPKMICRGLISRAELPFYCDCQTIAQLPGKESLSPEELARKHGAIYYSAIIHHGGIRRAFEKAGIEYQFEEITGWKDKITPFLGRLPDTVIAKCVDKSVHVIRRLRNDLNISRFTNQKALDTIET